MAVREPADRADWSVVQSRELLYTLMNDLDEAASESRIAEGSYLKMADKMARLYQYAGVTEATFLTLLDRARLRQDVSNDELDDCDNRGDCEPSVER